MKKFYLIRCLALAAIIIAGSISASANENDLQSIITRGDVSVTITNDAIYPWTVSGTEAQNGNNGVKYSTSWLKMEYTSSYRTELKFDWYEYNYSSHQPLQLYIDGVLTSSTSNSSWTTTRFYLDSGNHVIAFRDSIGNSTSTNNKSGIRNVSVKEIRPLETAVLTENSLPLSFTNDATWPWSIEDGYIQNTNYGTANSSSKFSTTFTIDKISKFSFNRRVGYWNGSDYSSDYSNYHYFRFKINGQQYRGNSYATSFGVISVALEPGTYTMEWSDTIYNSTYKLLSQVKDVELSSNWIDVELASAGTLGVEVLYKVDKLTDVELLKVKGPVNSTDWATIKQMTNLLAIDLSETTITSVPNSAFDGLSRLSYAKLPEGPTSIGSYAFRGTQLLNIDIPNSVKSIGEGAFYQTRVRTVNFGEESQLTTIGCQAFYQCTSLEEFLMPNTVTTLVGSNDYSDRRSMTFYECSNLKKLWLSDALSNLPGLMAYKADIRQLHLPVNLQSIGNNTFDLNQHLQKVDLPSSLTSIGEYAFSGCYALDSIILPIHLNSLGYRTFYKNTSLKYVELPSYIAYDRQFEECTALNTVVCRAATPPSISNDPFENARAKSAITLKVPSFAVVNYKLDSYWYQFGNIVEGDDIDYWKITSSLSLTNNRRMQGKPDIDLYYGGQFTVGGNAPMETGLFNLYVSESNPGRLLNTCEAMTADSINSYFSAKSETWYFITPLHDVDLMKVTVSNNASYVFRYYDGSSRATNGTGNSWRNEDTGKLKAGQGYIFRCNKDAVITFPAKASVHAQVFNTSDVTKQLMAYEAAASANKSWNFVGNPYPCYYDIYYMDFTAPITVWTGSTYKAYSIVDDNFALRPMQSFFVQKPDAVDNIIFHKEGRQLTSDINHAAAAPAFRAQAQNNRYFFDLQLMSDEMVDETRVVINSEASIDYEIERDASKFMSFETAVPQIFTFDHQGNCFAINERPLAEGTVKLAYYAGQSGFYTISVTRADGDIYLYDVLLDKTVNLLEQDYIFHSEVTDGTNNTRFTLSLNIADVTGINTMEGSESKVQKSKYYNLNGQHVAQPTKGIYIQNGHKVVK